MIIVPFQIVADIRILHRVIDHFRKQLDLFDTPVNVEGCAALDMVGASVQTGRVHIHAVRLHPLGIIVDVGNEYTGIAGQKHVSRSVRVIIIPGIGRERTAEALSGIKKIVGKLRLSGQKLIIIHQEDTGAAWHQQGIAVLHPDIIIVIIRKIVQTADGIGVIHIAQSVAGHKKDSVLIPVGDSPENDA